MFNKIIKKKDNIRNKTQKGKLTFNSKKGYLLPYKNYNIALTFKKSYNLTKIQYNTIINSINLFIPKYINKIYNILPNYYKTSKNNTRMGKGKGKIIYIYYKYSKNSNLIYLNLFKFNPLNHLTYSSSLSLFKLYYLLFLSLHKLLLKFTFLSIKSI